VSGSTPATTRTKWTRSQRFQLSSEGRAAARTYREGIVAARGDEGRRSFDAARVEWAARLALEPNDGLFLAELLDAPRTIPELAAALDGCGPARAEVREVVQRLVNVRMVEAVEPPPARPPPPRRW
jgi:hypothetical protein